MAKKLKMHFASGALETGSLDLWEGGYRPTACGLWHRKEITTPVKRRVTCKRCLKWFEQRHA